MRGGAEWTAPAPVSCVRPIFLVLESSAETHPLRMVVRRVLRHGPLPFCLSLRLLPLPTESRMHCF